MTTTAVAAGVCAVLFVVKAVIAKKLASWTLLSDGKIRSKLAIVLRTPKVVLHNKRCFNRKMKVNDN